MVNTSHANEVVAGWPEEAREAAQLVIDARGEPDEITASELIWRNASPWKRVVAQRAFWRHDFPAPHTDSVESFLDYRVPLEKIGELARFDGSVMVERTSGELSARCHDEQANVLALNLADEIVRDQKTVDEARDYYSKEFLDARRKRPTPYMDGLRVSSRGAVADRDSATLSNEELEAAEQEGAQLG